MAAEAGLKPFEIDSMAPADVMISLEGYELRERNELTRMRFIAFTIHRHSTAKNKAKTPEKWMPLYFERKSSIVKMGSPGEMKAFYQQRKEDIRKLNQKNIA
jgi:hypothetical protein